MPHNNDINHEFRNAILSLEGILAEMKKLLKDADKEFLRANTAIDKMSKKLKEV